MTKIFATGVTGYIGGDAIYAITQAHPEYEFTCLVRNSDKGATVAKEYPSFKFVYGDLDSVELIEAESKKADVVLSFASSAHEPSVRAMLNGVAAHDPSHPGFFIHTSGTGILLWDDMSTGSFGKASDNVYNDMSDLDKIKGYPEDAPHRKTNTLVLSTGETHGDRAKVAIVAPPTIYGIGRGPEKKRSHGLPELARVTLEKGYGITVNAGEAIWSNIHVHDLSNLYLKLVENAAAGGSLAEWPDKPSLWGKDAYYFSESGTEHTWAKLAHMLAKEAKKQGFVEKEDVKALSPEEAGKLALRGDVIWGCNSRSRATRARELLGWQPKGPSIEDEVKNTVEFEARKLGVKSGHAKVAAGDA